MIDLGYVAASSTIRIPWYSQDGAGASVTTSGFAVGDIQIYKDGSTTQRASTSGFTATTDFDGATGCHLIVIDLSDNSDAGFYAAGSEYLVMVNAVTVDSQTVRFWIARFRIGVAPANVTQYGGTAGTFASGIPEVKVASIAADAITAAAIAADAIGSSELAATAVTEIQTGLSTLDAAGVRTAVGLASANLDTQIAALSTKLDTIDDFLDTEIAAIKTVTDQFTAAQSEPSAAPAANATPLQKIAWLAALARNKITQTSTTQTLKADDGSTTVATATVSDDGTTFTRGEWA